MGKHSILFFVLVFCVHNVSAAILEWPDVNPPCDGILQACIDAANSGDEIEITTETPIDEDLTIDKSLGLYSASDIVATIGGGVTDRTISVVNASPATITVVLESLSLNNTTVDVLFDQGSGHEFTLRDSYIYSDIASNTNIAVSVDLQVPSSALVINNAISTTGEGIALVSSLFANEYALMVALANSITASSTANSASGIVVDVAGSGTVDVDVHSNLIYGVSGCNCGAAGILVDVVESPLVEVNIVNNTLDDSQQGPGILINEPSNTSDVVANIYNNIVTWSFDEGILVNTAGVVASLSLNNGYNNFYITGLANDFGGYGVGPATRSVNPEYLNISASNYHLHSSSPLIDAGTNSPNSALPLIDADSYTRVHNIVDMGAFEYPEVEVVVDNGGATGLGFLLLLAMLYFIRNRMYQRLR